MKYRFGESFASMVEIAKEFSEIDWMRPQLNYSLRRGARALVARKRISRMPLRMPKLMYYG